MKRFESQALLNILSPAAAMGGVVVSVTTGTGTRSVIPEMNNNCTCYRAWNAVIPPPKCPVHSGSSIAPSWLMERYMELVRELARIPGATGTILDGVIAPEMGKEFISPWPIIQGRDEI